MYMVVSRWEALPGQEENFIREGSQVAAELRRTPGVLMVEIIESNGQYVSVHGYEDEATYQRVVQDPNGPYEREHSARKVESYGRWLGSERGETIAHA
jgi:hypothetical protein